MPGMKHHHAIIDYGSLPDTLRIMRNLVGGFLKKSGLKRRTKDALIRLEAQEVWFEGRQYRTV